MQGYTDQVVWVTGASSGIGEALAKELARRGAKLILSARRVEELERVRAACGGHNAPVVLVPMDVADLDTIPAKAAQALDAFGRIDAVFNNAGISQRSLVAETGIAVDQRLMQVNYFGTVAVTKALLPHLMQRGTGRIVSVTSVVGKLGTPYRSAYAASKHAVHGFMEALRAELAQAGKTGIAVQLVMPGFIRTQVSVNALTGDGRPLGSMDDAQAQGMDPDEAARRILDGVARGGQEIFVGGRREGMGLMLKRLLPATAFARFLAKAKVR
ncbi:MAG: hypothetical protein RLY86_3403 [Pseudomonadota bacterium]|jgi:short-subunit dehydrogenase